MNNDGAHSWAEQDGTISLAPGRYTVQVDFFEVGGQEDLAVFYSGADTSNVRSNLGAVAGITVPTTQTGTVTVNVRGNVSANTGPRHRSARMGRRSTSHHPGFWPTTPMLYRAP